MIAPSLLHVGPQPVVTGALSGVKHFDTGFLHAISCWTRDPLRPRPSTKKQLQQPFCAYVCDPKNELVASAPEQSRSAHRGSQKRKFGTGAGLGRNSSAMATQKKSVDEIWKELNKRPAPRTPAGTAGIPNIPGISSMVRTVPKPKPSLLAEGAAGAGGLPDAPEAERKPAATYDPSKVGLAAQDVDTYVAGIQRLINCLSDPDRATRRQAAVSLQTKLTQGDAATPKATPQMLQALVCGPLLYPLITMLKDVVEKCRAVSVELLGHAARSISDLTPLVPALMPELVKRMGHLPVVEPAEEIRLGLAQLVAAVVERSPPQLLTAFAGDLCMFLCRTLEDGYHEIKKTGCQCIVALAAAVPASTLAQHTEKLAATLIANLGHQHSRVRVAVIEALDGLVSRGALAAGQVAQTIAPGVRPVAYDRAPNVREALFVALAHWLGFVQAAAAGSAGGDAAAAGGAAGQSAEAPDAPAVRAYASEIFPLLLIGVTDPQASIASLALSLVEGAGSVWASSSSGKADQGGDARMEDASAQGDAQLQEAEPGSSSGAGAGAPALGPPYSGRPEAGARAMARELLPQLLPPVIQELTEWTVTQRACAARSLHTMLVLSEDAATQHLPALLPSLCTAIGDEEAEVAGYVIQAVHVLGAYVAAKDWMPLILDHLANSKLSLGQRTNTLVVLSGLLLAAGRTQQALSGSLLATLANALVSEELRGALDHPAARQQMLAVATNVMRWVGSRCSQVSEPMYALLLQLYGYEKEAPKQQAVSAAMQQLAASCGHASWEALAEQHASTLMGRAIEDAPRWSAQSASFLLLRALLLTSGPPTVSALAPAVYAALKPVVADHEGDAQLRLAALQLVDELLEDAVRGAAVGGAHAEQLLRDVLLPPLTWRAGKTAAAVRYAAITALATLLRRKLSPARPLLRLVNDGTLLPLVAQELDEDWYVDVRNAACYVAEQLLLLVGPKLGHEPRRAMYPELLKRLDDSSNQVRIAACRALVAFCTTMTFDYCETNAGYLAGGVVIHMDDSDIAVQEAACSVLESLAQKKPDPTRAEVLKVRERFRSKHYCDRVLAACEAGLAAAAAAKAGGAAVAAAGEGQESDDDAMQE